MDEAAIILHLVLRGIITQGISVGIDALGMVNKAAEPCICNARLCPGHML